MLELTTRLENQFLVVDLIGELHVDSYKSFGKLVDQEINKGNRNIIFDLSKLSFVDSCGIGKIIDILIMVRKEGGAIALSSPKPMIAKTFELIRLDRFVKIYPSLQSAYEGHLAQ